jgi:deazaflavin-dependent oxidoreductase (nitroreductase family)
VANAQHDLITDRVVHPLQRSLVDPLVRAAWRLGLGPPGDALLETTRRRTGRPRFTPICDSQDGDTFWVVTQRGCQSDYVRNIEANPRVRVKVRRGSRTEWLAGTAHIVADDDPQERQRVMARGDFWRRLCVQASAAMSTSLLTIRIDLDARGRGHQCRRLNSVYPWPRRQQPRDTAAPHGVLQAAPIDKPPVDEAGLLGNVGTHDRLVPVPITTVRNDSIIHGAAAPLGTERAKPAAHESRSFGTSCRPPPAGEWTRVAPASALKAGARLTARVDASAPFPSSRFATPAIMITSSSCTPESARSRSARPLWPRLVTERRSRPRWGERRCVFGRLTRFGGVAGNGKLMLYLRLVRERVLPVVRELPGFSGYLALTDDDRGEVVVLTFWASEQQMHESEATTVRLRREAAEKVGATALSVERFRVAISELGGVASTKERPDD